MDADIIIPLARDRNYYELRMTLRSIEKNFSGYRDIYLIGEKPSWVQNVIHIPMPDRSNRKAFNIYSKMMKAATSESVTQNFISWADDTYLLEPLDSTGIKDWYCETLKHWTLLNVNTLYRNIIKNTMKVFPEGLFYNVHTPCIYEKGRFQGLSVYDWGRTDYLIKSMYFNAGESNPVKMEDPKRHKGLFYSTANKIHSDEEKMLRQLFPNPSRYETNNNTKP